MAHELWDDDYWLFRSDTLAYLKLHGLTIGSKAKSGDDLCRRIIDNYSLLYKSFDPLTHTLLRKDIEAYEATRAVA